MGCGCQNGTSTAAVDPCRRVNYSLGMILGVDDFVQESTYHSSHREALSRLALGWGTLSGLRVSIDPPEKPGDPLVGLRTGPGAALLPNGKLVHVDSDQCCNVANWVGELDADTFKLSGAPSGQTGDWAKAWVTLSFCESKCADVPVPGDPCRTDDKLTAPSRVQDGFVLDLSWSRPDQTEEDAVRDFFQWILSIGVDQSTTSTEDQILAAIRQAAKAWIERPAGSTIVPSDFLVGTPSEKLFYKEGFLRSVLRLWNTELRPLWSVSCSDASRPAANTLALAELWIPLKKIESRKDDSEKPKFKWVFDTTRTMVLDHSERPDLLSLRAVQEMTKDLKEMVAASVGRQPPPYEMIAAGEIILTLYGDKPAEAKIVSSYHSKIKPLGSEGQSLFVGIQYERTLNPKLTCDRIFQFTPVLVDESTNRFLISIDRTTATLKRFGKEFDIVRIESLDKEFGAKRISFQYQVFEFASPDSIGRPIVDRVRR